MRALLVGFGEMGEKYHLPLLREQADAKVVGIVRQSRRPVEDFCVFGADELQNALEQLRPELAIVASPHSVHADQVELCLRHDCHVLCEKPLALDLSRCRQLVELAKARERLLVVNLQRRYEGPAAAYRRLVQAGKLGKISTVFGVFYHRFAEDRSGWRLDPQQSGAGIIEDSGYHLIDLLSYFASSPMREGRLFAVADASSDCPNTFSCIFQTESGCQVTASAGYSFPRNAVQEEISVVGSEGSLFVRRFRPRWNQAPPEVLYVSADGETHENVDTQGQPFGRDLPLQSLLEVLRGKRRAATLYSRAEEVLETHRIVDRIKAKIG
jgi:predicted dehydrogenase